MQGQPTPTKLCNAHEKLRLPTLHLQRRCRMRRRSCIILPPLQGTYGYPCCAATAGAHERPQEKEPKQLNPNTTPCGSNLADRREKKERGGQLTCTGSCAWPPAPKAIQGLNTEGSVWVWRGPKSTGTGEESARKGLKARNPG